LARAAAARSSEGAGSGEGCGVEDDGGDDGGEQGAVAHVRAATRAAAVTVSEGLLTAVPPTAGTDMAAAKVVVSMAAVGGESGGEGDCGEVRATATSSWLRRG